ncbi:cyclic di-GMP phosphodiesterase Gmr [Glaciecola punicea ACAM 611]|uniref:Cyclic di-GMP phosphodiesterase Gmr n=1 Tax=Glaciecola punicea ACAM 611 TaxID=1121923 RepID=H5TAY5_9ALTE|nr:GGDEF and EAL domain-containing protein [Glaciecola punicea]GAB55462.1 cyclic di-GMP phosphodiesterase Gmr [Glaciecola punicea ACAM 611]
MARNEHSDQVKKRLQELANAKMNEIQTKATTQAASNKHKNAEEKLHLAAIVYDLINEAIMVFDAHNILILVNRSFTRITGYTSEEALGQPYSILRSRVHDDQFYKDLWQDLNAKGQWEGEICNLNKNGEPYIGWLTICTIYNSDNSVSKRVGLLTDITERKRAADISAKQANFDTLTGLPNRRLFQERLSHSLLNAETKGGEFALFSIDLDQFKDINDSLGHQMGDSLLIEAAKRLQACICRSDTVSRLGGDEFTVIIGEIVNIDSTKILAQRILDSLSAPFNLGDNVGHISASIGIVIYPKDGTDTESLIKNADQAMYAAKTDGRNCLRYFTKSMEEKVQKKLSLNKELRNALAKSEFWVAYQPIINLASGKVHKAESLLRWEHPELGNIPPIDFIPICEEYGLIASIGNWVFEQASLQTAVWRNTLDPNFQTSINVSPAQFKSDRTYHKNWLSHLDNINLDPQSIAIEITEGLLMEMSSHTTAQLDAFDAAGIEISLDDFGTGYSSLAYLQKFHIHYLKIDQSFIENLTLDSDNMVLCEAMIVLAHRLGVEVIAEGIETQKQRDLLLSINCDYGQGYLFSKPLTANEFETFVLNKHA